MTNRVDAASKIGVRTKRRWSEWKAGVAVGRIACLRDQSGVTASSNRARVVSSGVHAAKPRGIPKIEGQAGAEVTTRGPSSNPQPSTLNPHTGQYVRMTHCPLIDVIFWIVAQMGASGASLPAWGASKGYHGQTRWSALFTLIGPEGREWSHGGTVGDLAWVVCR